MSRKRTLEARLEKAWYAAGQGQAEEAIRVAEKVRADAIETSDAGLIARSNHHIAWFNGVLGRAADALEPILAARTMWASLNNQAEVARTRATYAWILMELGDSENAISEASDAMLLAERAGDGDILALASNTQALALVLAGQLDSAVPLLDRAISLGRENGDEHALARWLINRGYLYACLGDRYAENGDNANMCSSYMSAIEINAEGLAVADNSDSAWYTRIALANAAEYHGVVGNIDEALALLERWQAIRGDAGDRLTIQFYYTQSEILTRAGRSEDARSVCELAVQRARASGITLHELNSLRRLSEVYEAMGKHKEALDLFKKFHGIYKRFSGEMASRRARITEVLVETEKYKSLAQEADKRATMMAADALRDPLTGVANRRSLDKTLAQLDADDAPYAIAVVDLDHFKKINDRFSHLIGDDVLRIVAETLTRACRPTDFVARMGGEEFVIVFFGASPHMSEVFCGRVRTKLAAVNWSSLATGLTVTASIGLAFSEEDFTALKVLGMADRRLYDAKNSGRNCVISRAMPLNLQ